jgi:hypothetical protein
MGFGLVDSPSWCIINFIYMTHWGFKHGIFPFFCTPKTEKDSHRGIHPPFPVLTINSVLVTRLLMDWLVFQIFCPHKRKEKQSKEGRGGKRMYQKNGQQDNPKGLSKRQGYYGNGKKPNG